MYVNWIKKSKYYKFYYKINELMQWFKCDYLKYEEIRKNVFKFWLFYSWYL